MKSFSLDFYGGMLWANNDFRDTSASQNIVLVQDRLQFDKQGYDSRNFLMPAFRGPVLFDLAAIFSIPKPIAILGWEGAISSFTSVPPFQMLEPHSGMHVDTWLNPYAPTGKMANDNFGFLKTRCFDPIHESSLSILGLKSTSNLALKMTHIVG